MGETPKSTAGAKGENYNIVIKNHITHSPTRIDEIDLKDIKETSSQVIEQTTSKKKPSSSKPSPINLELDEPETNADQKPVTTGLLLPPTIPGAN